MEYEERETPYRATFRQMQAHELSCSISSVYKTGGLKFVNGLGPRVGERLCFELEGVLVGIERCSRGVTKLAVGSTR